MTRREHDKTQQALAGIAAEHLGIETLETRNSDSLDFHEVSVWSLQAALEAAFQAGRQAGPATIQVGKDIKTYAGQEARITRAEGNAVERAGLHPWWCLPQQSWCAWWCGWAQAWPA